MSAARVEALDPPAVPAGPRYARPSATPQEAILSLLARAGVVGVSFGIAAFVLNGHNLGAVLDPRRFLLAIVWFGALLVVYQCARVSTVRFGGAVAALAAALGFFATSLTAFWIPGISDIGARGLLLVAACAFVLSIPVEAALAGRVARRKRMILVGGGEVAIDLLSDLARTKDVPFECIGMVTINGDEPLAGVPCLGAVEELALIAAFEQPDLLVISAREHENEAPEALLEAGWLECRLMSANEFYEHALGRVPIRHLSPAWFMGVLHAYRRPYRRFVKRALDLVLAGLALVVFAPLLPLIALLVRLSGPGPVLYRQARVGERGVVFEMLKFRTMVDGAERPGKPVWCADSDPRITRIGRVLRKLRLDELPQLLNVLRGEMSFIGPRPERPEFLSLLENELPFWRRRNLVKPGITGWAQVQCGYTSDVISAGEKLSYDLYYLKHRSLVLDLTIAAKTAGALLAGSVDTSGTPSLAN